MAWVTITGSVVSTSTKFGGTDHGNKIANMFNGTDVSDTVTINAAVTWTFENGSFKIRNPADTYSYLFTPSAIVANRTLTLPLLTGTDTVVVEALAQTLTNKTLDADNLTCTNWAIGSEVTTVLSETEEMWVPAGAFISTATSGAEIASREMATNDVNFAYAGFDTTTDEFAEFVWTMPKNWDAGTVKFTAHWTNTAGLSTETVTLGLAGVAFANDDPLDTAYGTIVTVADTWIAQNDLHISPQSTAVTIAGSPVAGQQVHFKLSRDVSADNLTGDCDVLGIVLEYTVDDIGTT